MSSDSVSFARDVHFGEGSEGGAKTENTNVDGIYAVEDVEAGTVVFTEEDAPDGELCFVSEGANCEVVELEEGGRAVVTVRDVKVGEFFTVLEDDDDDDDDDDDNGDEEEEFEEEEET